MCGSSPFVLQGAFPLNLLLSKMSTGDSFGILIMHLLGEELIACLLHTEDTYQQGAPRSSLQPHVFDTPGTSLFCQHVQYKEITIALMQMTNA